MGSTTFFIRPRAGLITWTFDITVSNFTREWITGTAPVDPVMGSVTVTFGPSVDLSETTANITLNSLNIALASPIAFRYDASEGFFEIGVSKKRRLGNRPIR